MCKGLERGVLQTLVFKTTLPYLDGQFVSVMGYKNAEDSSSFLEQRDVCISLLHSFRNPVLDVQR